jgi:predicted XRE-type DNA-binding protein
MGKIPLHHDSGNVFRVLGFSPAEAAELTVKSSLIDAIREIIEQRGLTQKEAAKLCNTDQPTLAKVLNGRMKSGTIERLAAWLTALGRTVEIHVRPYNARALSGQKIGQNSPPRRQNWDIPFIPAPPRIWRSSCAS